MAKLKHRESLTFKYAFEKLVNYSSGLCIFRLFSLIFGIKYFGDNEFIFPIRIDSYGLVWQYNSSKQIRPVIKESLPPGN